MANSPPLPFILVEVMKQFLEGSQLTVYGLMEMHQRLQDNTFFVFYRNLHFSTMYKHKGRLYLLVTDQGYSDKPNIVWEQFDQVDNDTVFVDANFHLFVQLSDEVLATQLAVASPSLVPASSGSSEDFARKLQEEFALFSSAWVFPNDLAGRTWLLLSNFSNKWIKPPTSNHNSSSSNNNIPVEVKTTSPTSN